MGKVVALLLTRVCLCSSLLTRNMPTCPSQKFRSHAKSMRGKLLEDQDNDDLRSLVHTESDRRSFLSSSVVFSSAALLGSSGSSTAHAEEGSQLVWRSAKAAGGGSGGKGGGGGANLCSAAKGVYNKAFTSYLARFLLSYDLATKSWWDGQPKVKRADLIGRFEASLKDGLAQNVCDRSSSSSSSSSSSGSDGSGGDGGNGGSTVAVTAELCAGLAARFGLWVPALNLGMQEGEGGGRGTSADAAFTKASTVNLHLALLFSLLDEDDRPTALIEALLTASPNPNSSSSTTGLIAEEDEGQQQWWSDPAGLYPIVKWPELDIVVGDSEEEGGRSISSSSSSGRGSSGKRKKKEDRGFAKGFAWLESTTVGLKSDLRREEEELAAAVRSKSSSPKEEKGVEAAMTSSSSLSSSSSSSPPSMLSREAPLRMSEYALFGLAGMLGCTFTHAVVVPLDGKRERKE
jgi:hypothetical protein